jgi:hypothetical protein
MSAARRGRRTGGIQHMPAKPTNLPEEASNDARFFPPAVISQTVVNPAELAPDEHPADGQTVFRIEHLTKENGWLLITAGVVGTIMPGIVGMPFLLAGAVVLVPGGPKLLSRWVGENPPKIVQTATKQIGRFLDDLERRYPRRCNTAP